jgi:hypothetical protein
MGAVAAVILTLLALLLAVELERWRRVRKILKQKSRRRHASTN